MDLPNKPIELTDLIREQVKTAFKDILPVTNDFALTRERGYYGVCFVRPSRNVRNALSVDRELLVLISTFEDQQTRTIQTAKELIAESEGRLDSSTFVIIHRDSRGNAKLKKWGREQGLAVLPIYFEGNVPSGDAILKVLSHELFSYDVFDVTGPVADDVQFYGRREEARELAKKLQSGQIRSCFGIRKIGKTSILHRVMNEVKDNYDCTIVVIDAQRDSVFNLTAGQLLSSLATTISNSLDGVNSALHIENVDIDVAGASEKLQGAVNLHTRQILLVFDEVDYLTPTSPTAAHWKDDFNPFWRNLRAIYQSTASQRRNLSLLVSGVSSKWFSEESIGGVENAALSFIPEEYLSPLPRGAAGAMIRRLGRSAGLVFNDPVAEMIAETCADMPFWIRKACSFIHAKIDIGLRPFEPQQSLIRDYLKEFVSSDGTAMSEVALAHLFRVYPELKVPAFQVAEGNAVKISPRMKRTLLKYGLIGTAEPIELSGDMMSTGLQYLDRHEAEVPEAPVGTTPEADAHGDYGEWADELAIISRRRNILERKLRGVVGNFIRFSSMTDPSLGPAKDRILKCVDARRRVEVQRFELDDLMTKLMWLELVAVIKKEWQLFDKLFGDKSSLDRYGAIVNDRPDAHAKDFDLFDAALHRRAVAWFEERLSRV